MKRTWQDIAILVVKKSFIGIVTATVVAVYKLWAGGSSNGTDS